jgi:hypothetical protein
MIGEAARLINAIEPVADILSRTVAEAIALLRNHGPRLVVETPA